MIGDEKQYVQAAVLCLHNHIAFVITVSVRYHINHFQIQISFLKQCLVSSSHSDDSPVSCLRNLYLFGKDVYSFDMLHGPQVNTIHCQNRITDEKIATSFGRLICMDL